MGRQSSNYNCTEVAATRGEGGRRTGSPNEIAFLASNRHTTRTPLHTKIIILNRSYRIQSISALSEV
jgi:hypothetical protein